MPRETTQNAGGTSYHGHKIVTTLRVLLALIGNEDEWGFDEKTQYHWTRETEDGEVFTIYDYHWPRIRLDREVHWHIGAKNPMVAAKALAEVEDLLFGE
jgi:hypothetical protein